MKRKLSILAVFIMVSLAIASCQQTPEHEVVIQKDIDLPEIVEKIEVEPYTAPDKWQEKIDTKYNDLTIEINADIEIPDSGMLPIATIETIDITDEMANNVVDVLFGGKKIYEAFDKTKSEIEQEIINEKAKFTDPNSVINEQTEPEMKEIKKQVIEKKIQLLEEQLLEAPVKCEYTEVNKFELRDGDYKRWSLFGQNQLDKNKPAYIIMWKDEDKYRNNIEFNNLNKGAHLNIHCNDMFQLTKDDPGSADNLLGVTMPLEDAIVIADEVVSKVGASNLELSEVGSKRIIYIELETYDKCPQCYILHYTNKVNDALVTYDNTVLTCLEYAQPWSYESITVCVDDSGIIAFEWKSPSQVKEILCDSVELIEFDRIKEIFQQQFTIRNAFEIDENAKNRNIVIDEIVLGLMRVAQKDNPHEFLLIPVWDFYGYVELAYNNQSESQYVLDENNMHNYRNHRYSFLTINAIDGSIIDRSLGY